MDLNKEINELIREVELNWQIEVVTAIKEKIQNEMLVDTGELADSIRAENPQSTDGEFKFIMSEYGQFQDEGVNPVGGELYQTPFKFKGEWKGTAMAIKNWSAARGLNPWAVARVLQFETGIRPKRFFKSTIEALYPKLGDDITDIISKKLDFDIQKRNTI